MLFIMTADELLDEALQLPLGERAALVAMLYESMSDEDWRLQLERRRNENGEAYGSVEELKAALFAQLKRVLAR
jgi:hypothetical protein